MASQAQALNNDTNVEIYETLPDVTNTTTYRGLKDSAYVPGNRPKTPELTPKPKKITILTSPNKGSEDSNTRKGTGILTVALFAY